MPVSANGTFLIDSAMKSMIWERAKGEMRALIEVQGSYSSSDREPKGESKWEKLQEAVETFISEVEDNGLHE
jgi:hypothetical protein